MAIYEFFCEKCEKCIEKMCSYKESIEPMHCEECETLLVKQYSLCRFILKGGGFYKPSIVD